MPQRAEERFGRYRDDPVDFCQQALGVGNATRRRDGAPHQFAVLEDVVAYPRAAVPSGHGVGKSAVNAWAGLWWLLTRPL